MKTIEQHSKSLCRATPTSVSVMEGLEPKEIEREKIQFFFHKQQKLRRGYRVYLVTATLAIVLALAILLIGFDGGRFKDTLTSLFGGKNPSAPSDTAGDPLGSDKDPSTRPDPPKDPNASKPPADTDVSAKPDLPLTLEQLYQFNYAAVPKGKQAILPMDLSLREYGVSYIQNQTTLSPDTDALLKKPLSTRTDTPEYLTGRTSDGPRVLIVHTHATEAYSADGALAYDGLESDTEIARSTDATESVVAVGKALADELERNGVSTVHCQVMHDAAQYRGAYDRSKETVERYLEQYPSIVLVIDLHRDAIFRSTGEMVRPVTLVDGEAAAQVMCVVGSNDGGEEHARWEDNLALALQLRSKLNEDYGNLCRPSYLKSSTYNQELAPYSLLLEIGACGNSLEEAKRSATVVARALAELLGEIDSQE